jgi:hypothetical protein
MEAVDFSKALISDIWHSTRPWFRFCILFFVYFFFLSFFLFSFNFFLLFDKRVWKGREGKLVKFWTGLGLKRYAINLKCDSKHVSCSLCFHLKPENMNYILHREYVGTKLAQPSRFGVAISCKTKNRCIIWNAETGIYTTQVKMHG